MVGVSIFVVMTLAHEIIARSRREAILTKAVNELADRHYRETEALRELNRGLLDDVALAREEMAELCDVVEAAAEGANQTLLQEMKTLQTQLGRSPEEWVEDQDTREKVKLLEKDLQSENLKRPLPQPISPDLSDSDVLELIQDSLEENRVDLYLQPIVALPQRKTRFYEAYSRVRTADGQVLLPDSYIAIAEKKGLMEVIDNLLLFRCVQLVRRLQTRQVNHRFFVNISSFTFQDARFFGQFIDFMATNKKLASNLIFEFEQSAFLLQSEEVAGQLRRLANLGFSFSIDRIRSLDIDFEDLHHRNVRHVKIPASLLLSAHDDPRTPIHPEDIKELAARAEVDIICDRIESEKQVVEILEYDVDYGQGYLFGAPRPLREGV